MYALHHIIFVLALQLASDAVEADTRLWLHVANSAGMLFLLIQRLIILVSRFLTVHMMSMSYLTTI